MNIIEEENDIKLDLPSWTVDNSLGDHIPSPFKKQSFFYIFTGRSRSGKSSLAIALLCNKKPRIYRRVFDNIIVVIPSSSLRSLKKNCFETIDNSKKFDDLSYDTVNEILDLIEEYSANEEQTLLYIDDMTAYLKQSSISMLLSKIINNRRHYLVSIIIIVQNIVRVPLELRKLATMIFFWKSSNRKELEVIKNEYINLNNNDFNKLIRFVFRDPYDFMIIDNEDNELYRKFNHLILDDTSI